MNCDEVREALLDSLAERRLDLESHIATCEGCARFADVQQMLDARLTAAVPVASLSPGFRTSLRKKLRQEPVWSWPESLPDIAHLAGCIVATVLALALLPQPPETVLVFGAGFTAVTYFLQATLRSSLEAL